MNAGRFPFFPKGGKQTVTYVGFMTISSNAIADDIWSLLAAMATSLILASFDIPFLALVDILSS